MSDLWPDNLFDSDIKIEESNAVELLREQAKKIKEKSKGAVCASVTKIENPILLNGMEALVTATAKAISKVAGEDELKDKKSIAGIYTPTSYKFELYNETYKFRLLEIVDRRLFPVTIASDEDVENETNLPMPVDAKNNKEVEDVIRQILASKKVRSVIQKMKENKSDGGKRNA